MAIAGEKISPFGRNDTLDYGEFNMRIYYRFICLILLASCAQIESPSIPGSLTATAVSDSQIDLIWTASSDF